MTKDLFACVCFLALMQSRQGLMGGHPSYIDEKRQDMLRAGYDAFAYLDYVNQALVIRWFEQWHVEIPVQVKDYWEQTVSAVKHLGETP